MISFFAKEISLPELDFDKISLWIQKVIKSYSFNIAEISFIFCNDEYLYDLNIKYLNHDYYTDILTFNYNEGKFISGDLFISIDRVSDNAKNLNCSFTNEILRVCIHGVLHLLGLDDTSTKDKALMRMEEDRLIKIFFDVKEL